MAEELARSGVERAVVSPGSRSTPLAVALWRQPEIEVTVILDERSAGFFALGTALGDGRARGGPLHVRAPPPPTFIPRSSRPTRPAFR